MPSASPRPNPMKKSPKRSPKKKNNYAPRNHHHRMHRSAQGGQVPFALHHHAEQEAQDGKAPAHEIQPGSAPPHPPSRSQIATTYATQNSPRQTRQTRRPRTLFLR